MELVNGQDEGVYSGTMAPKDVSEALLKLQKEEQARNVVAAVFVPTRLVSDGKNGMDVTEGTLIAITQYVGLFG